MTRFHSAGHLKRGPGWRVGLERGRGRYCALVGGDRWGIELTGAEWQEFVAACQGIQGGLESVADVLMPEESVTLEQSGERITVIAMGLLKELTLYLQVHGEGDRHSEGFWEGEAVGQLWQAVSELTDLQD